MEIACGLGSVYCIGSTGILDGRPEDGRPDNGTLKVGSLPNSGSDTLVTIGIKGGGRHEWERDVEQQKPVEKNP